MTAESNKIPLVLLHGWGVNRQIWNVGQGTDRSQGLTSKLSDRFEVHRLDLPGYGDDAYYDGGYRLPEIVARILANAPKQAIWVAWSLGATVAMQAARQQPDRFLGLQLVAPTPRFMAAVDWPHGTSVESLSLLKRKFETGYQPGLKYFLLLQTTDRNLIRKSVEAICELPAPKPDVILQSLNLLTETDLREAVEQICLPVQIVLGTEDRVVAPAASRALFERLSTGKSEAVQIKHLRGGHLCFLESELEYLETLDEFASVAHGS